MVGGMLAYFTTAFMTSFITNLTAPLFAEILLEKPFPFKGRRDVGKSDKDCRFFLTRAEARLAKTYRLLLFENLEDEAGEEAWRAVVDALNAISVALWGYELYSHHVLGMLVEKLKEMDIVDIRGEYGNAVALHKNFYRPVGMGGKLTIEANIRRVERLIVKIRETIEFYEEVKERYRFSPFICIAFLTKSIASRFDVSRRLISKSKRAIRKPFEQIVEILA